MVCLLTSDVDACVQRALNYGGRLEKAPHANTAFGIYTALLRDPKPRNSGDFSAVEGRRLETHLFAARHCRTHSSVPQW